jgi:hypothetical protein
MARWTVGRKRLAFLLLIRLPRRRAEGRLGSNQGDCSLLHVDGRRRTAGGRLGLRPSSGQVPRPYLRRPSTSAVSRRNFGEIVSSEERGAFPPGLSF